MKNPLRLQSKVIILGMLIGLLVQGGCAARKITALWCDRQIVAEGHASDWQGTPQYYDQDHKLVVRVTNNSQAMVLSIESWDDGLKRELRTGGLTLWIDPQGGRAHVFGIHLPGAEGDGRGHRPHPGAGALPPGNASVDSANRGFQPSPPGPLHTVSISYQDATGPLEMTMDEVRRTGIDIAVRQHTDGRLIYEFKIGFHAAPSLAELQPGMLVGVGIMGCASVRRGGQGAFPGAPMAGLEDPGGSMGGPGPGGGPRGAPPGGKGRRFETWLKVRLAVNPNVA